MGTIEERKARVYAAFRAMKDLGIHEDKTKLVLKKLLKLYNRNWDIIEAENYRLLADAIFDDDDNPQVAGRKMASDSMGISNGLQTSKALEDEAELQDEPEHPLKRLRLKHQDGLLNPNTGESSSKKFKLDHGGGAETRKQQVQDTNQPWGSNVGNGRADLQPFSPTRNSGKQPVSSQMVVQDKVQPQTGRASGALQIKEGTTSAEEQKISSSNALIRPKDEPFTDDIPPCEVPLAVVHPESTREGRHCGGSESSKSADKLDNSKGVTASSGGEQRYLKVSNFPVNAPKSLEIAASTRGEVKLSLSCNFVNEHPNFRAPSLGEVIKYMQDKCLRSYTIIDPCFSVEKLLQDFCDSFLELGTNASAECREEPNVNLTPADDVLMRSAPVNATSPCENGGTGNTVACSLDGSVNDECSDVVAATHLPNPPSPLHDPENCMHIDEETIGNGCGQEELSSMMDTNMNSIVAVNHTQPNPDDMRCLHDANDITRGEEKVKVPLLLDSNSELLPSFYYIPQNVVSQEAYVNISLAQIGEEDCCPTCCGDCLLLEKPCMCTYRNGGEFSYTSVGVLKDEYLEECVALIQNPKKQHLLYCKECPLERLKSDDMMEPCKGHLGRKFIKECWSKCGCSKHCANWVVQRGITWKLQVFLTPEGKGWGLRTLEDLPKGAFMCEFVGEILTIVELHKRNSRKSSGKHSYAVLLDADWGSRIVKDEQALCLDASSYGNVARFINHRCYDANLVHIPVEVDTTNHLYYRVAFFTARNVDALEELTWDYGVDFDDTDHHFKTFSCLCGSSFCRNMKRSNRSISASVSR